MTAYSTSYCNHPHRVKDGKPINHECYILPPKALAAEMADDMKSAISLIEDGKKYLAFGQRSLLMHRGIRVKETEHG